MLLWVRGGDKKLEGSPVFPKILEVTSFMKVPGKGMLKEPRGSPAAP